MTSKKEIMQMLSNLLDSKFILYKRVNENDSELNVEYILCSDVSKIDATLFRQNLAYVMNIAADNDIYENCSFRSNLQYVSNIW